MTTKVRLIVAAIALAAFACGLAVAMFSGLARPGAAVADRAAGLDRVLATVGDHSITQREVDEYIRPQMLNLEGQLYDLKRSAIDDLADEYLLEQAAARENLTVDQYLDRAAQSAPQVNEEQARQIYDQNKQRFREPFEKIKTQLVKYLNDQSQANRRAEAVEQLRKGVAVQVFLEPPRYEVAAAGFPVLGPSDAPITIVEFSDFQCPYCKRAQSTLSEVMKKYEGKVKLVYRDFPLANHPDAIDAARAARCAGEQGKFWEYHDQIFANQSKLKRDDLKKYAADLSLNQQPFDACLDSDRYAAEVQRDMDDGQKLGVSGTPTFFIEGRRLTGAQPLEKFTELIDDELARKAKDGAQPG